MTREALRVEHVRERSMVPRAKPQSYYGQPVLKEPVWKPEIPFYFYTGGLGGASAGLALMAEARGNRQLARRAWLTALAGVGASPVLLISDLGRPSRFLNMLRMFKVTSPMSVGSWILASSGSATAIAVGSELTGLYPEVGRAAKVTSALLGLPLATYTAGLVANTSVPAWHDARFTLPIVFAGSSAASAGAAATALTPARHAAPARRLAVGGAVVSVFAGRVADTGVDPVPLMRTARFLVDMHPNTELLWSAPNLDGTTTIKFRDLSPADTTPYHFLRLHVERVP